MKLKKENKNKSRNLFKPNALITMQVIEAQKKKESTDISTNVVEKINLTLSRTTRILFNYLLQNAQFYVKQRQEHEQSNTFTMAIKDLIKISGIKPKSNQEVKDAIDKLGFYVTCKGRGYYLSFAPIPEFGIKDGVLTYKLSDRIIELLHAESNFTKLNLAEIAKLKQKNAIFFYEYLKQYENAKIIPKLEIAEIYKCILPDSNNPRFTDLEKRILQPALEEINAVTGKSYTYVKIQSQNQNKVEAIQFFKNYKEEEIEEAEYEEIEEVYTANYEDLYKRMSLVINFTQNDFNYLTYLYDYTTLVTFVVSLEIDTRFYGKNRLTRDQCYDWLYKRLESKDSYFKKYNKRPYVIDRGTISNLFCMQTEEYKIADENFCKLNYIQYIELLAELFEKRFPNKKENYFRAMYFYNYNKIEIVEKWENTWRIYNKFPVFQPYEHEL